MKKHTIRVTQRHIDQGKRNCPYGCMVALAIEEAIPGSWPTVDGATVLLSLGSQDSRIDLPAIARDAIDKYDDGQEVEPFQFDLEVPEIDS